MSPYVPTEFDQSVNVSKENPLTEALRLLAGTALLIAGVYGLLVLLIELALPHIPVAWENKLWQNIEISKDEKSEKSAPFAKDEVYLKKILAKIPESSRPKGYDFKIHLADSSEFNAFAMPGGHIVVTKALLKKIKSENTLVFLIGHELGHFAHRDHLRGIGTGMAATIIAVTLSGQADVAGDAVSSLSNLANLTYSRHAESQADLYGLKILHDVYGHAGGATDLFEILKKQQHIGPDLAIFSTHPLDQDRIERLKAEISAKSYEEKPTKPLSK